MPPEFPHDLGPVIAAIRRHFAERRALPDALGRELAQVLALLENTPGPYPLPPAGRAHPIARQLQPALADRPGRVADVLAALRPFASALPWRYGYAARADAPGLEDRIAWAEFIGPAAPRKSDRLCLGVTLIASHTLYPAHRHPAVETYFVLAGTATWTAAGRSSLQPPGAFILHPSNIDHAMETGDEPLLAVYTWSGDIRSPSAYSAQRPPETAATPSRTSGVNPPHF